MTAPTAADAARLVERLVNQISHWTPSRFGAASAVAGHTRGDVVHALAQHLADLGADAEGQPRRPVPRLGSDLALPDQIRVLADDLLAANPEGEILAEMVSAVASARDNLMPHA